MTSINNWQDKFKPEELEVLDAIAAPELAKLRTILGQTWAQLQLVRDEAFIDACWQALKLAPKHKLLSDPARQQARGVLEILWIQTTGKVRDD
jgi:hypothetical protein